MENMISGLSHILNVHKQINLQSVLGNLEDEQHYILTNAKQVPI